MNKNFKNLFSGMLDDMEKENPGTLDRLCSAARRVEKFNNLSDEEKASKLPDQEVNQIQKECKMPSEETLSDTLKQYHAELKFNANHKKHEWDKLNTGTRDAYISMETAQKELEAFEDKFGEYLG